MCGGGDFHSIQPPLEKRFILLWRFIMSTKKSFLNVCFLSAALLTVGLVISASPVFAADDAALLFSPFLKTF